MTPLTQSQPLHAHLRRHAREKPDAAALVWYGRAISWRDLDDWSDALGAHLQSLGVGKGAPVALFMNNCPQYLVAHYAIQKIGAIVCPCGPLNKAHELEYQLGDLQARVIIAADNLLPIVDQVRAQTALQHVLAVRYGDLLPTEKYIDSLGVCKTQGQFDALVDFAFNLGCGSLSRSTLLQYIIRGKPTAAIQAEFLKWNRSGKNILNGLTKRRQWEARRWEE